jgi:hypothetical protein
MAHAPRRRTAPTEAEFAALDALLRSLTADGAEASRSALAMGLSLDPSGGARTLTGEPAPDDRVREASVVARVGTSAAALVVTACGDVWLLGFGLVDGVWRASTPVAIVDDAHPGACRITHASAASCAMLAREAREVVVTFDSGSEEGDEARDPLLRVYELGDEGALSALSDDIGFGGTDDTTGAVRDAQWVVDDALMIPRDLYIQVQPGSPGPGGTAPPYVVRRTYRVEHGRLALVEETSERVRPRGPPSASQKSMKERPRSLACERAALLRSGICFFRPLRCRARRWASLP